MVTLSNGTARPVTIRGWSIGTDFAIVGTTCPAPPAVLPAAQSCTYSVAFQPKSAGTKNELFSVFDPTLKVKLRGVGTRH